MRGAGVRGADFVGPTSWFSMVAFFRHDRSGIEDSASSTGVSGSEEDVGSGRGAGAAESAPVEGMCVGWVEASETRDTDNWFAGLRRSRESFRSDLPRRRKIFDGFSSSRSIAATRTVALDGDSTRR